MILQVITYIFGVITNVVTNMTALSIDEYISLIDVWLLVTIIVMVILIVKGVIRHNGNSG